MNNTQHFNTDASPQDAHTQNVSAMFGRMTPWYDLQNRVFSLFLDCWWRRSLVCTVVPGPANTIVDLAAGTLDVSLALIRRYPGLHVYAADICEPMLRYGEEHKIRAGERSRITTMVTDARQMPLPDGCADAVTMAFGIRNVRPRIEALKEMHRMLIPGGRACILEFAPVSTPLFGSCYHWYLRHIMPKLAGLVSRSTSAYDYFADTIENFPQPEAFSEELRQAGFAFVQHIPLTLGVANIHIAIRG
jgi:demethylmenaquinone methyltransferase/2-methoxy-6-polyprenyl-1,4-benzoquinol methylase